MLRRIYPYMKPYAFFFVLTVFFILLDLLANIYIPWLTGRIIDDVFKSQALWPERRETLYQLLLYLILGFIVLTIAIYLRGLSAEWFSQNTVKGLRADLFGHMQRLDMNFYHHNTLGELMSRASSDVEQLRNFCANSLMMIVLNLAFFPFALIYMMYLNWRLTLLCLLVGPVIAILAWRFSKIGKRNQRYNRQAYAKLSAVAQESLSGIRLVQNFMSQKQEIQHFNARNQDLTWGRQRSLRNWAKYMPILETLGSFSNILALVGGAYMVIRGYFSLGTWIQFSSYTWMLVAPMRQLGDLINGMNFARISAERIFSILDEKLEIQSPENAYSPSQQGRGEIEFVDVTWHARDDAKNDAKNDAKDDAKDDAVEPRRGEEEPQTEARAEIIKNINLNIPAGTSLGIIGETGAGKTTLANLICRFADPSGGLIKMDGVDLRSWDLKALRAQISYVMQEPFLFSDTLSYNIGFDQSGVLQDKIIRSAQRSAAHGFIGSLENGYQTIIGDKGVDLSGGQRQRTALARALVKEAPILILDDTTSAVDMETEKEIQEQLEDIESHHTRIIIAHRLSSVMNCDQIIVIKNGEIIERGTHQSLVEQDGYYSRILEQV